MPLGMKIPKAAIYLSLASLFNDVASEAVYPLLPNYMANQIGLSILLLGVFEGLAESLASFTKIYSGYVADQGISQKKLVFLGYSLTGLSRPLYAFIANPLGILLLRLGDRFGKGIRSAPRDAWLGSLAEGNHLGFIYSFHRALDHLGAAIGPLLAAIFLWFFPGNMKMLFLLTLIPTGIILTLLLLAPATKQKIANVKTLFSFKHMKEKVARSPRELKIFFVSFFLFSIGQSSEAFLLLRWEKLGADLVWIPIIWMGLNLLKSLTAAFGGRFSDRYSRKTSLMIGWSLFFVACLGLAFADSLGLALLFTLPYGLHFAFAEGPSKAYVSEKSRQEDQGTLFGFYNLLTGIAALPASALAGYLWQNYSPAAVFYFSATTAGIALLILWNSKSGILTANS
jgi:MFS family permease